MIAFSRVSSFTTVIKFFNIISFIYLDSEKLGKTNYIKKFYNSCKAALSASNAFNFTLNNVSVTICIILHLVYIAESAIIIITH